MFEKYLPNEWDTENKSNFSKKKNMMLEAYASARMKIKQCWINVFLVNALFLPWFCLLHCYLLSVIVLSGRKVTLSIFCNEKKKQQSDLCRHTEIGSTDRGRFIYPHWFEPQEKKTYADNLCKIFKLWFVCRKDKCQAEEARKENIKAKTNIVKDELSSGHPTELEKSKVYSYRI